MWKSGKLEVGWGFAAMLALALLAGAGEVLPLVGLSALCHELGHLGALRLAGAEVECFRLSAFGAEIQADTRYLPYPKEILSRVAGDYVLAGANLLLGVFNLLPIPSLDGGRALYLLVSWCADPAAADWICRRIGLGCAAALTMAALVLTLQHRAGLFLLLGAVGTLLPQLPTPTRRRMRLPLK